MNPSPSFDGVLNRCKLKSLGLKPAEVFDLAENSGANSSSKRSLETSSNWSGSGLQLNWALKLRPKLVDESGPLISVTSNNYLSKIVTRFAKWFTHCVMIVVISFGLVITLKSITVDLIILITTLKCVIMALMTLRRAAGGWLPTRGWPNQHLAAADQNILTTF